MEKLIILDRDGVINEESKDYIKSPAEWRALPGSLEAIAELNRAGHRVVVVTNQGGIAKGFLTLETMHAIHQKMRDELIAVGGRIEKIYFCPHGDHDHCTCRKPKPGMLEQVAKDFKVDLKDVFFIVDKYIDFQTAQAAGCPFILVTTGYGKGMLEKHPDLAFQAQIASSLQEAVRRYIFASSRKV
jgi:D-glycero-D-manno-heptose 1,7-bisphosphate phosphatase